MSKGPYKNLVTIPSSTSDSIVGSPNTGVGGDIVANFKAIADVIHPESPNSEEISDDYGSYSTTIGDKCALNVGCNFTYSSGGKSYHILNNTADGLMNMNLMDSSSSPTRYGVQSGAFMKGVLMDPSKSSVTLMDVPHAGGMLVEYNIIAIDNQPNVHIKKGTLYVYPGGIIIGEGADALTDIGAFSVSNGDLIFSVASGMTSKFSAIQIGLHGTVLSGLSYSLGNNASGVSVYTA